MTHIRLATHDDLDRLRRHEHVASTELEAVVGRQRVLVAEEPGGAEVVGWLRWGLFWDQVPFMNLLRVDEPYRRRGIGTALVRNWESQCRDAGSTFVLTSTQSDESAQQFYRQLGYVDAGALVLPGEPAELFLLKRLPLP